MIFIPQEKVVGEVTHTSCKSLQKKAPAANAKLTSKQQQELGAWQQAQKKSFARQYIFD